MNRVGLGFDLHPATPERPLVLGGVTVPAERGLAGHSDADVLSHAVAEAMLGALALVMARGARLVNVDATVVAQSPRLSPWLPEMAKRLAETLRVDPERVSVKAKSPEGLGLLGRREGIAAMAVVNLEVAE